MEQPSGCQPVGLPDWSNLTVLHKNTLEPRSSFYVFASENDALSYDVARAKAYCLSGTWKFHLAGSPFEAPEGFEATSYDTSAWTNIQVPSMWQLCGHGRGPQYVNVQFPIPVNPPHVSYVDNETGSYVRKFKVPMDLQDHQLRLRFEGVDSAFHVWLNGKLLGYSQGSRNPSEFDISAFIDSGADNVLAVRVYQYCDGTYIEDQDEWRMSGIFRDVYLLGFPVLARVEDLQVETRLDERYINADLLVKVQVTGPGDIGLKLLDSEKNVVAMASENAHGNTQRTVYELSIPVKDPLKWTAETPNLYHLVVSYGTQFLAQRIGFRQVELKDGLIKVNGKRVVFRGTNRHEHHPTLGRAVPLDFLRRDLLIMKTHNINAIRTSHQPNDIRLYDLADELGFWVIDEADLECHGFEIIADAALSPEKRSLPFAERQMLTRSQAATWTTDNPEWKQAYLDRAIQLVTRDKLHPSVIIWSLGNEAFFGRNFKSMYDWIKAYDPTRLVHYEPDLDAEVMDMHSRMYPHLRQIIQFGEDETKNKPLILCEFIHAMGTGPGNIKEYIDAFYKYPKLQGGFAWEWANHGLRKKDDKTGDVFYAYGGDFGDIPNDSNFVMDGLLNSDHTPTPGLLEYKKAIEPVQLVSSTKDAAKIINRYDFVTLDHLECIWSVTSEGAAQKSEGGSIQLPPNVAPGATADLKLPQTTGSVGESFIDLSFCLKEATSWAEAGFEVAFAQIPITASVPIVQLGKARKSFVKVEKIVSGNTLIISTESSTWKFNTIRGELSSWSKEGIEIISKSPKLDFWRAPTDNDAPQDGWDWKDKLLHLANPHTRSVTWSFLEGKDGPLKIHVVQRIAPPVLSWSIDCDIEYVFEPNGSVKINAKGSPSGENLPKTLPRIGFVFEMPEQWNNVEWYGRGPGESYSDSKFSQKIGTYSKTLIDELWTECEFPQESSNRTDTRWVRFGTSAGARLTAQFLSSKGERKLFDFMASHYRSEDIDEAKHPYELHRQKRKEVVVRLDAKHHGLGTGSCGPKTIEEYALKTEPFEFNVLLH